MKTTYYILSVVCLLLARGCYAQKKIEPQRNIQQSHIDSIDTDSVVAKIRSQTIQYDTLLSYVKYREKYKISPPIAPYFKRHYLSSPSPLDKNDEFIKRFDTKENTYQREFEVLAYKEYVRMCKVNHESYKKLISQFILINQLIDEPDLKLLVEERQKGRLPIVDSIFSHNNTIDSIHICNLYEWDRGLMGNMEDLAQHTSGRFRRDFLKGYDNDHSGISNEELLYLDQLRNHHEKILKDCGYSNSRIPPQSLTLLIVPPLPQLTGNIKVDAAVHLKSIFEMLTRFISLNTTPRAYMMYEQKREFINELALLKFRREFCFYILCKIKSK